MKAWCVFLLLAAFVVATPSTAGILDGTKYWTWTDGNAIEHTYYVVNEIHTWDNARQAVRELGSGYYLATVTSHSEQDALAENLDGIIGEFWLGGVQNTAASAPDLGWSWADTGESFSYTNWKTGEPNDWNSYQEMHLGVWSVFGWQWNDEHGTANIQGYIVETGAAYSPNPEPATMLLFGFGLIGLAGMGRKKFTPRPSS